MSSLGGDGSSVHRFKTFKFRVAEIKMSPVAGSGVCLAEGFGLRPGGKVILGFPKGVGSVENMILAFGPLEEVKGNKSRLRFEIGVTGFPDFLKFGLLSLDDTKTVHGNVRHSMQNEGSGCEGKKGYFDCIPFMTWKFLCKNRDLGMS